MGSGMILSSHNSTQICNTEHPGEELISIVDKHREPPDVSDLHRILRQ